MNKDNENEGLRISDEVLVKFVELVQLAMLTGTDVVDYMRMLRLREGNNGEYVLADGQVDLFERQVKQLLDDLKAREESVSSS